MLLTDKSLIAKRGLKKKLSSKFAYKMLAFVKANFPNDEMMIKRMIRQIKCSSRLEIYSNGVVKSIFCKEKTCSVCNSIRLAKFLDKYLDPIKGENIKYHMVLTVRNPGQSDLKSTIDKMYDFFNNSSLRKDKAYRGLNKTIKMFRSFETTLNEKSNTYNVHFHILLAGQKETEVIEYGKLLIDFWLKYFKEKANIKAQYLEKQEKSILENFKYLFKINDITVSNIRMVYHLLKAIEGKRLFTAKNIHLTKETIESKEEKFNDIEDAKLIETFNYMNKEKNWINDKTGEIFVQDQDYEKLKLEKARRKKL